MKMIKINVIFVHGIEFSTFTEKLREIGEGSKFDSMFLRGQPLKSSKSINLRLGTLTSFL